VPEEGVPYALALHRAAQLSEVEYNLSFDITAEPDSMIPGHADVSFTLKKPEEVVLDFYPAEHEHLVYPAEQMRAGRNTVHIDFKVDPRLLNHRGNLVYTLSVPDKSRRLFPCFDQPDLKATYRLTLTMPSEWVALSNGAVVNQHAEEGRTVVQFAPTEPLSTYLFAFTAGRFQKVEQTRDGRTLTLYHTETDPALTAQCDDIFSETFAALRWQEEYTGIPYPFAKYEMALIPGFQFGGMEHTGATLYNDRMLFLQPHATINERLARTALIAHETSHMWFGDYVTMKWFGEVWTKEVFANYYAAAISEPLYPEVNHKLRFMLDYAPTAYNEDRTQGANSIQQSLDNLQDAGMVYGNIIYNKSPMMMRQLVQKVGGETFRKGIHDYLSAHAYGNATWDELIETLDSLTTSDLKEWSRTWLHEAGMPEYRVERKGGKLILRQDRDVCPQQVTFRVDGETVTADCEGKVTKVRIPRGARVILPNTDGMAYGYFALDSAMWQSAWGQVREMDDVSRGALLINLYEALWRGDVAPEDYINKMAEYLPGEKNDLLFNMAAGQVRTAYTHFAERADECLEQMLMQILLTESVAARKTTALRTLMYVMDTPPCVNEMYRLWKGERNIPGFQPGERELMSLTYQLAVHLPEQADSIVTAELNRLSNENLRKEFRFVSPAVSPHQEERDSVFAALLKSENRRVEPWAGAALALLNHRCRRAESEKYLMPGLEAVIDVKRTGDIFFPKLWVSYLLGDHTQKTVHKVVDAFFAKHPDYPPMLKRKILLNVR
jgi:aminopeptidase N